MNYLREFLYRPKKSDRSLMARFFYADESLTAVAAELDSFDGRKDPERCASLVNRLRSCQDKLLGICNKMLEELEPGTAVRSREFRAKFPDDIMTDNLAGQLWFGAECLAAGSSIMNKESESEAMRPLAKAVTKSLEKVRALLREQCLTATHDYTEKIRENLKIFDRLFADFEYNYVRCMVHVKTIKEYDLHQDLIVLFSDTLSRAISQEMIGQDQVDNYEPSLMFAIPRLAIVYGLLICPDGPLCVDRGHSDFPSLFLPFKNLLRKIRELLQTLEPNEIMVLEMLLCQHEEPANIATKLKEVERMLENKEKTEEGKAQALKLQLKLDHGDSSAEVTADEDKDFVTEQRTSQMQRLNSIPCQCGDIGGIDDQQQHTREAVSIASDMVELIIKQAFTISNDEELLSEQEVKVVEIDCTEPEIKVSPRRRFAEEPPSSSSSSTSGGSLRKPSRSSKGHHCHKKGESPSSPSSSSSSSSGLPLQIPRPTRSSSGGLKRHNARRDTKRLPLRYQKDRRAKFKSTEDLIHRLYVCISGAADQLQSNYAGDFRSILRVVFLINTTPDDVPDQVPPASPEEVNEDLISSPSDVVDGGHSGVDEARPPFQTLPQTLPTVDLATDALQHEMSVSLYDQQLRLSDENRDVTRTQVVMGFDDEDQQQQQNRLVYAQNLDLHMHSEAETRDATPPPHTDHFYQPEPTLLDIASGAGQEQTNPQETLAPEAEFVAYRGGAGHNRPPPWVPDADAPNCMGCRDAFTFVKRRHHCRACGKVFCGKCSGNFLALPHYGLDRPVRVCNRCHVLIQPDPAFFAATSPGSPATDVVLDGSPSAANSNSSPSAASTARSPPWNRTFGMVS